MSYIFIRFLKASVLLIPSLLLSCDFDSQGSRNCLNDTGIFEYLNRPDSLSFSGGVNDQSTWELEYLRALSYVIPSDSIGVSFDSTTVRFKVTDDQASFDFCKTRYGQSFSLSTTELGCVQSTMCYRTTECLDAGDGYCDGRFIVSNAAKAQGDCDVFPDTPELAIRNIWNAAQHYIERNNRAVIANDRCDGWIGLRQKE